MKVIEATRIYKEAVATFDNARIAAEYDAKKSNEFFTSQVELRLASEALDRVIAEWDRDGESKAMFLERIEKEFDDDVYPSTAEWQWVFRLLRAGRECFETLKVFQEGKDSVEVVTYETESEGGFLERVEKEFYDEDLLPSS